MNNKQFFNSFHFVRYIHNKNIHTDNYNNGGADSNYLGILLKGTAKLISDHETVELKEGEIVFIPKKCRYHSYWSTDTDSRLEWNSLAFGLIPHRCNSDYILQKLSPDEKESALLREITDLMTVSCETIGKLYMFFASVSSKMKKTEIHDEVITEKAVELMRGNTKLKMNEIAKLCGISESGLYGSFKKYYHISPNEIRQKILCEKAEELLTTTNIPIDEISDLLGFSSASYFRKILNKHTGKTPTQIRKSCML